MNVNRDLRSFTTLGRLGSVLVLSTLPPETRAQGGLPPYIEVTGIVRDFSRDHPDFDVVPTGGYGHYAMNVALDLGAEDSPTFRGTGFRVDTQWRDGVSNPIAPHLYGGGVGLVRLANTPKLENQPVVDTFDSSQGPYDPNTAGPAPSFYVGAEMPTVNEPVGLPPLVNEWKRDENHGTTTIANDIHCNNFLVSNHHTILIDGNRTIFCEKEFKFQNHAHLELLPGATLTLYTKKVLTIQDQADANINTADPSRFVIYHLGTEPVNFQNQGKVYARVIAPNAKMRVQDGSDFYGTFTGKSLHLKNQGGFHIDGAMPDDACGVVLNDTMGTAGIVSTGGIDSADSFGEWYRDILGTNLSTYHPITLINNGSGVYEYLDNDFHPIDGMLLGNEGDPNNNYFTFVIDAKFTYQACAGQFFQFRGADDAWLFVDGKLAIDLGGVLPLMDQHVDMDRLELTDGQTYRFIFFFAHRQPGQAVFDMQTNMLLDSSVPTISAVFD